VYPGFKGAVMLATQHPKPFLRDWAYLYSLAMHRGAMFSLEMDFSFLDPAPFFQ
jgi:hypothetical protein